MRRHRLVGVFWERSATIKTESANRAYTGENWREKRNNIIKISDGREVGYQRNHVGIYDEWGFHFIYQYRRIAKFQHPKAIFFFFMCISDCSPHPVHEIYGLDGLLLRSLSERLDGTGSWQSVQSRLQSRPDCVEHCPHAGLRFAK